MVSVPSSFFEKISSNETSSVYKCLSGCTGKYATVTVFHSTLNNARRHITVINDTYSSINVLINRKLYYQAFHNAKLSEFNAQFAASGKQVKKKCDTIPIDQHFSKASSKSSSSPIKTQDQLDNEIMVGLFIISQF
jgi:hypothetical protein